MTHLAYIVRLKSGDLRGECACGWAGQTRSRTEEALTELETHLREGWISSDATPEVLEAP